MAVPLIRSELHKFADLLDKLNDIPNELASSKAGLADFAIQTDKKLEKLLIEKQILTEKLKDLTSENSTSVERGC